MQFFFVAEPLKILNLRLFTTKNFHDGSLTDNVIYFTTTKIK